MTDRIQVDVDFPESTEVIDGAEVQYPAFKDAIYLTFAEYDALSEEQLDALRLERYNAWRAHMDEVRNAPPVVVAPADEVTTLEELRQQTQSMLAQIDAQIAARNAETPALEA